MNITDFRRSTAEIIIGTATNTLAIGGVAISSNAAGSSGAVLVATGSNSAIWRDAQSFGSNTNDVSSVGTMGSSSSNTRADHVHRGVSSISHSSNTFYGGVTLTTPGNTVGITSPSSGTLAFTAPGSGGGGGASLISDSNNLGANLAISAATYTVVASLSVVAGTWLFLGYVLTNGASGANPSTYCEIQDATGAARLAQEVATAPSTGSRYTLVSAAAPAVLSVTSTIEVRVYSDNATTAFGSTAFGTGGGCKLIAIKIG